MKLNSGIVLSAVCFLTAGLLFLALARTSDTDLAKELAPQVLRFHILANSNRHEDQELKLDIHICFLFLFFFFLHASIYYKTLLMVFTITLLKFYVFIFETDSGSYQTAFQKRLLSSVRHSCPQADSAAGKPMQMPDF